MAEYKLAGVSSLNLKPGEKQEVDVEGVEGGKVLLLNVGGKHTALGAKCTHYGAPLVKGVLTGDGRITCPWHGACFNTATGDIENAPAIDNLPCFELSEKDGAVFVKGDIDTIKSSRRKPNVRISGQAITTEKVVIVGGGSGGLAASEGLRELGFKGTITVISSEGYPPIDRTKLSKALIDDPSKIALRDEAWFNEASIDFINDQVTEVDFPAKKVSTKDGKSFSYTNLVLATGGSPRTLPLPGFKDLKNIFVLRTAPHAKAINAAVGDGKKNIVVIGSSFIGMEVGNALAKNNNVSIVGMESAPLERILGKEVGQTFQVGLEKNGVKFYLNAGVVQATPSSSDPSKVGAIELKDGTKLEADLVILGTGVRPETAFLEGNKDLQLLKDFSLQTDANFAVKGLDGVYAIGDIATYPYHGPGGNDSPVRIEHWNVAQNSGRSAAAHITGSSHVPKPFIPIFWSALGNQLRYCGSTLGGYDDYILTGEPQNGKFVCYYTKGEIVVAVATVNTDPIMTQCAELMRTKLMPSKSEIKKGVDVLQISVPAQIDDKRGRARHLQKKGFRAAIIRNPPGSTQTPTVNDTWDINNHSFLFCSSFLLPLAVVEHDNSSQRFPCHGALLTRPAAMAAPNLEALIGRIPTTCTVTTPSLKCCCGRADCVYLTHSCSALEDLERELRTAAQLGQALLIRNEHNMLEAERERSEMSGKISKLESDKMELELQNQKKIQENRELLDQLEELNGSVAESESHIKSLETALQSTNQELRRLEQFVERTRDLEIQLAGLEQEREVLQRTIVTTEAEERSALQRWRSAERRLNILQEELEQVEREAREERLQHTEVLNRMDRQRTVEKELATAAGRLKGAAAATASTSGGKNGSSVVSHFVKDILQDNANLQVGIVELRQMLMDSNDEVQALREKLQLNQPLEEGNTNGSNTPTLREELGTVEPDPELEPDPDPDPDPEPRIISQALHIHHHYHTPSKKDEVRRPKKKRASINNSLFTSPSGQRSPTIPRSSEASNTILQQTSVTIPTPISPSGGRWSASGQYSDFAPSSAPSSPQSAYRSSSIFDRGFDTDYSRPTSPGSSVDPLSPAFNPSRHRKRSSDMSGRSFIAPINFFHDHVIHEENDDVEEIPDLQSPRSPAPDTRVDESLSQDKSKDVPEASPFQPLLRRSTSHESILSISGIDIHTLRSRPSQLMTTGNGAFLRDFTRSRDSSPVRPTLSIDHFTGSSYVTARPTLSRQGRDSTSILRSSIGSRGSTSTRPPSSSSNGFGKLMGDWVWNRWGISPVKSDTPSAPKDIPPPKQSTRAVSMPATDHFKAIMGRSPGINQPGPIPGFKKIEKAPAQVTPEVIDREALNEVLIE
ncbi:hypothetical protein B7463_g2981, partial [Scytalidium lignicola]